ncbi:MAG: DUF5009 domain-containing protein [Bacteroidales bacterium]|nr:DUF5009 domain-containing protein [Bacteroidales bacterium]
MGNTGNGTGKRVTAIDCLRGLSMFFMIFGAAIWWYSGLPGWMFHCQVPPPDYAFHPEVRGITYMDLVFPFFLFSMGAAIPFALRKRLERGGSHRSIIGGLLRRWVTLVMFSLLLGNTGLMQSWDGPDVVKGIFAVVVWGGFFLSLWRTDRRWASRVGYLLLLGALCFEKFYCRLPLNVHNTDVIIMILAWVALGGGLVWLVTKDNLRIRGLILLVIVAVRAVCAYTTALDFLTVPDCIGWLFSWGFLQYLIIAIPASIIGDLIARSGDSVCNAGTKNRQKAVLAIAAFAAVAIQPWLLYTRNVVSDICLTVAFLILYGAVVVNSFLDRRKNGSAPAVCTADIIAAGGFILTLAGLGFDFIDGGIAKDFCNLSYLFTTCGMAALVTVFFLYLESLGWKSLFLADCGQNPMIAYTICWYVISPLLYGVGLLGLLDSLCPDSPFWAIVRGLVVTGAMCAATAFFTRKKLFWRS